MEFFNSWVQGIVVAVIITILIEMILPEGNSKKYIKIVLGIYVVFSIISPIIGKITGGNFEVSSIINMDKYAKELGTYEEIVKERNIEYKNSENIKQIYVSKLEEDIKTKLKNKGFNTKEVELNIKNDESYEIKDIKIYIDKENDNIKENSKANNSKEDEKRISITNIVNEIKIDNITIGRKQNDSDKEIENDNKNNDNDNEQESNTTFFERKEIKEYISETYGVEEDNIKVY